MLCTPDLAVEVDAIVLQSNRLIVRMANINISVWYGSVDVCEWW